jgi:hypothetical protein
MRYELIDRKEQSSSEDIVKTGLLTEADVPNWPSDKKFPTGVIETSSFSMSKQGLQRIHEEVFDDTWSLQSVLLLMYACVDVQIDMAPLTDIEAHLTHFAVKEGWLEHHTRVVSGTTNEKDIGFKEERPLDELKAMEPHFDKGEVENPSSPGIQNMMAAGRSMVMQHEAELLAMAAVADFDPGYEGSNAEGSPAEDL